jgi:hypothetical protein
MAESVNEKTQTKKPRRVGQGFCVSIIHANDRPYPRFREVIISGAIAVVARFIGSIWYVISFKRQIARLIPP